MKTRHGRSQTPPRKRGRTGDNGATGGQRSGRSRSTNDAMPPSRPSSDSGPRSSRASKIEAGRRDSSSFRVTSKTTQQAERKRPHPRHNSISEGPSTKKRTASTENKDAERVTRSTRASAESGSRKRKVETPSPLKPKRATVSTPKQTTKKSPRKATNKPDSSESEDEEPLNKKGHLKEKEDGKRKQTPSNKDKTETVKRKTIESESKRESPVVSHVGKKDLCPKGNNKEPSPKSVDKVSAVRLTRGQRIPLEVQNLQTELKNKVDAPSPTVKQKTTKTESPRYSKQAATKKVVDITLSGSDSSEAEDEDDRDTETIEISEDDEEESEDSEEFTDTDDEDESSDDDEDDIVEAGVDSRGTRTVDSKQLQYINMALRKKLKEMQLVVEKLVKKEKNDAAKRDEEMQRMKNELSWKDEQIGELNELVGKNMELEARISMMLSDRGAYDKEVNKNEEEEKWKEQEEKEKGQAKEREKGQAKEKEKGQAKEKEKGQAKEKEKGQAKEKEKCQAKEKEKGQAKEKEKGQAKEKAVAAEGDKAAKDSKVEEDKEVNGEKPARKHRGKTRGKKGDDGEGAVEDIDAYFVGDDQDSDLELLKEKKEKKKSDEKSKEPKKKASTDSGAEAEETKKQPKKDDEKSSDVNDVDKTEKDDDGADDDEDEEKDSQGRHNIRKLMQPKKLQQETKQAARQEKDRRDRVKEEHDKHLLVMDIDPKTKLPVASKLVLSFKKGTKTPLVEVNTKLIRKLKPHQVEAVEFMWDSLVESMDRLKEEPGSGCILAHCMGLGKTLSVIALVHTMLTTRAVGFKRCMVICPLNTVLNWQYEWEKWLDKKDRLHVYEMASSKGNHERAELLLKWKRTGGVMIMGYQLFRIMVSYTGRSKRTKKAFDEGLVYPGADVVICDEGHMLKNDASAISKCTNLIHSKRRIILTGTPLQNNLAEYHCMVNFVKPNLLGTRREFCNRFVNPITNGQHKDSTPYDVRLMKRRAHIIHEMLAGCVQRRDYSSLTKFLPPKQEYVISVRLSPVQIQLYEKYLQLNLVEGRGAMAKGTGLFADYQNLMRIWTHPWVLKLDEIRQEKKAYSEMIDDELDSVLYTSSEEDTDVIEVDDSTEDSESTEDDKEEEKLMMKHLAEEGSEEDIHKKTNGTPSSDDEGNGSSDSEVVLVRRTRRRTRSAKKEEKTTCDKFDKPGSDKEKKSSNRTSTRPAQVSKSKNDSKDKKKTKDNSTSISSSKSDEVDAANDGHKMEMRKAKIIAGEVIRQWKSATRGDGVDAPLERKKADPWWSSSVSEDDREKLELSGKLVLLFEIVRMAETIGDKVLVFSQSILSLDLIEDFLRIKNEEAQKAGNKKGSKLSRWVKDEDYHRMDGGTGVQNRRKFVSSFNNYKNTRIRLFLISTRAGGLGINLDVANRVIIFDASWNPSHDIQSIFRVYRFGQEKDVFVYRLLAQGTMEEKIYERQITKETLSQRVIDEHQLDSHFTASDLQELYLFKPDRLDDPNRPSRPTPAVPKDIILAELLSSQKDWIVQYHEHDSLLENRPDETLSEEERQAAWDEYEREKKGLVYRQIPSYLRPDSLGAAGSIIRLPVPMMPGSAAQLRPLLPLNTNAGAILPPLQGSSGALPMPRLNVQIAQLPRVVQEILKYNPNITADELQVRLQAFLGMHSRFTGPPNGNSQDIQVSVPADAQVPTVPPFNMPLSMPLSMPYAVPAQYVAPPRTTVPSLGLSMPSRLPQPGMVPAMMPGKP